MAKCCVHINKIKSMGTLKARWNHDLNEEFRKEHVANANADEFENNNVLVNYTNEDGEELSYDLAVKDRIKGLKQADGRRIRKDAVLAYDVVLEFGDADDIYAEDIDVDEWEKRSVEWLRETFNVAGDGKENVISVVCHKDEASPHIHSIVTPVDEKGNLCARSFTYSPSALSHFQDTYAAKLADLGIERGVRGSSAHHKSNRKYNAEKNEAIKKVIPEPKMNQSAMEYYNEFQNNMADYITEEKRKIDKMGRDLRTKYDQENQYIRDALKEDYDIMEMHYEKKLSEYRQLQDDLKDENDKLYQINRDLKEENEELMKKNYDYEELSIVKEQSDHRDETIKVLSNSNPELVNEYFRICDLMDQKYELVMNEEAELIN